MGQAMVIVMNVAQMIIRNITTDDIASCINLFRDTVHSVNACDYSPTQIEAWAPNVISTQDERWQALLKNSCLIAEMNSEIVGFGDMNEAGYIDRLYVHKDHQGKGIATIIINELENRAIQGGICKMSTEASITAKPFFEAVGYQVVKENQKYLRGEIFTTYLMIKTL